jgi:hypothetical protein
VIAFGDVDLDTARGREAWRLMKKRVAGFSFGYMVTDAVKRADGGRRITALDIFEVSVTMMPMNNDTRVIGTKAHTERDARAKARELMLTALIPAEPDELREQRARARTKSALPVRVASFECDDRATPAAPRLRGLRPRSNSSATRRPFRPAT